jgi:hypothetical protein
LSDIKLSTETVAEVYCVALAVSTRPMELFVSKSRANDADGLCVTKEGAGVMTT